jgi:hypothetical protein
MGNYEVGDQLAGMSLVTGSRRLDLTRLDLTRLDLSQGVTGVTVGLDLRTVPPLAFSVRKVVFAHNDLPKICKRPEQVERPERV